MNDDYSIRAATIEDLEVIAGFTVDEGLEAEGENKDPDAVRRGVRAGLEDPELATYWVVVGPQGKVVASTSVVREWSDWNGGFYWWIQSLYITPKHRGRGLVERILDHLSSTARANGAVDLRLYAHNSNQKALAVYRRCGFDVAPYTIMSRPVGRS